uniref:rhomboid protease n=1 Tax=Calidris pygmaea TaxID=425635 RepID=A0A8C3KFA7_9CHAR
MGMGASGWVPAQGGTFWGGGEDTGGPQGLPWHGMVAQPWGGLSSRSHRAVAGVGGGGDGQGVATSPPSRAAPAAPRGHGLSLQISSKRSSSFKRAIANGQRALPRDGLLDETGLGFYKRFVRYVAYEILPCEMDRRWYFYQHRTCPPPVFMAAVTLTQIIVFLCYGARLNKWVLQTYHPEYMKSPLVYHPGHRARAWRFLTYMFMHVGLEQLGFNALLQLMIGVPLEMVHGILRISFLYLAGVLAGGCVPWGGNLGGGDTTQNTHAVPHGSPRHQPWGAEGETNPEFDGDVGLRLSPTLDLWVPSWEGGGRRWTQCSL